MQTIGGKPVLRFERWLAHPPAKVWRAITDPAEAAHWFPALIETELEVGARMRFTFPEVAPVDGTSEGEILELDPPKVYAFRWKVDVLRFELVAEGAGTRLVFTQTISDDGWAAPLTAGRSAAGWDVCLDALAAQLDDQPYEPPQRWLGPMEHYIEKFGLAEGEVLDTAPGFLVRFRRDLVWKPLDEVWSLLVDNSDVRVGAQPPLPATNGYFEVSAVTAVEAPRLVEYEWTHEGEPAGRVRWEFTHDPELGTRVELTQTLPQRLAHRRAEALAVWQVHLESFFAATHGEIRCPWPEERTAQLQKTYAARLSPTA
jgi:uncharacterized protein YndB with AHSA1/START domain